MRIEAVIKQVCPAVTGTSQNGEYKFVPIVIEWKEQFTKRDGTYFEIDHSQVVHVMGNMAQNFSIPVGSRVCIDLRFNAREYNGKMFNSVSTNYVAFA